jgi:thiopurine S-methyltransferase
LPKASSRKLREMEREFWFERWREGRTAFNEGAANRFLVKFAARLADCERILVPLCGKAEDLAYLAGAHDVVGIELVEDAIKQFFAEHELTPTSIMTYSDSLKVYRAGQLRLIAGDFFATTPDVVGPIDAVYDRAAIVALPPEMRARYVNHLRAIAPNAKRQLIVSLEYPPGAMEGPPFSVPESELRALYPDGTLEHLDEAADPRGRADGTLVEHCFELRLP